MFCFSKIVQKGLVYLVLWGSVWPGPGSAPAFSHHPKPTGQTPAAKTRLNYDSLAVAQNHLKPYLLKPIIPLNAMRRQVYAALGAGKKEGFAGWETFNAKQGKVRACIVPGSDGAERATIVSLSPKDRLSWRDLLKSEDAMAAVTRLRRNEDGKKTLQIRVGQLDSYYAMQITLICGEEWIEQITWTLVG